MHAVYAGRLDAAMLAENSLSTRDLDWSPFIRKPLFLIAPPGTPVTDVRQALLTLPFVRFRSNVPLARLIETELGRMNLPLNGIAAIDTISDVTACVENGLAVSIVPRIAAIERGVDLVMLPFGDPPVFRQIGLLQRPKGARAGLIAEVARASGAGQRRLRGKKDRLIHWQDASIQPPDAPMANGTQSAGKLGPIAGIGSIKDHSCKLLAT